MRFQDVVEERVVALDRAPRAGLPQRIIRPHTVVEVLLLGLLAGLATGAAQLPGRFRQAGFAALCCGALLLAMPLIRLLPARSTMRFWRSKPMKPRRSLF